MASDQPGTSPLLQAWLGLLRWDKPSGRLILLIPAGWALWLQARPPAAVLVGWVVVYNAMRVAGGTPAGVALSSLLIGAAAGLVVLATRMSIPDGDMGMMMKTLEPIGEALVANTATANSVLPDPGPPRITMVADSRSSRRFTSRQPPPRIASNPISPVGTFRIKRPSSRIAHARRDGPKDLCAQCGPRSATGRRGGYQARRVQPG